MPDLSLATEDWQAIALTARLAAVTLLILFAIGLPLAWWLARTHSRLGSLVSALVAVPLVLPPTVLGFYLLVLLGPQGPVGRLTESLGIGLLPFTFPGLVVASTLFSLPFVVQPLQASFAAVSERMLEVAATLRAEARKDDWVCRVGGEEFLVICPNTPLPAAARTAERLRQAVRRQPIAVGDQAVPVTVSIGIAAREPLTQDADSLVRDADKALYAAKHAGRDRCCLVRGGKTHLGPA